MTSRIWKEHQRRWGDRAGEKEVFVVEPRQKDGVFLVKKRGIKGNRDEAYEPVATLDEVWQLLQGGRSVRMKGQQTGEWSTLNGKGAQRA